MNFLRINGDVPLSIPQRLTYIVVNALRNQFPYSQLDEALRVADFVPDTGLLKDISGTPSPSRALSDLLWRQLQWQSIEHRLGSIHMFDIGCGSGAFGERLQNWSGERIATYTGLDVRPNSTWETLASTHAGFRFCVGDAQNVHDFLTPNTNLIVSQSALEHVPDDFRLFRSLNRFLSTTTRRILQIHLLPSQGCLRLYRFHGFRQYTARRLSSLIRLVRADVRTLLVRLGGAECNSLHARWITAGDRRSTKPDEYRRELARAIAEDAGRANRSPAFYALMMETGDDSERTGSLERFLSLREAQN